MLVVIYRYTTDAGTHERQIQKFIYFTVILRGKRLRYTLHSLKV